MASLHNKDPHVQSAAMRGLIDLQLAPEQLAPQLTTCITDCDSGMIDEMMDVLSASGEAGLPGLIAALKRPPARARAAVLLEHLGPKAAPAVPELIVALSDKDSEVRREVLYALGAIIADKGPADPAIVAALDDPEPAVRATAAYALGRAGPVAKAAVPKLRTALEADDLLVRVTSAWALASVSPGDAQVAAAATPVLMRGLEASHVMMRRGSAEALGQFGKGADQATAALKAATRDEDETVRAAALEALEKIGAVVDSTRRTPVPRKK